MPCRAIPFAALLLSLCLSIGTARADAPPESLQTFRHIAFAGLTGAPGDIAALAQDRDGFLWMKVPRGSVRFDGKTFESFATVPPALTTPEASIDADGNAWSVVRGEVWVTRRGAHAGRRIDDMPQGLREVVAGRSGRLYVRDDDGVRFYHRDGVALRAVAAPIADAQANGLMESRSGALWITRTSGVVHVSAEALAAAERDGRTPVTEVFGRSSGLTGAFPHPLVEDDAGNVWVGTEGGLDLFRRSAFTAVALPEGIHRVDAGTDSHGNTWVGSDNLRTLRIDDSGARATTVAPPTYAMVPDTARDAVWAANATGLWRLDRGGASLAASLPFEPGLLAIDAEGRVVAAPVPTRTTPPPPTMAWDGKTWSAVAGLPGVPAAVATDRHGATWFGMATRPALARVDARGVAITGPEQGLAVGAIRAIAPARDGVWIGGDDGIQFFDGMRFRTVPIEPADLLRWVTGIVVDASDHLWIETSALVFRSRDAVAGAEAIRRTTPLRFDRFDYTDGIPGGADPDHGLPSLRTSADGRIWAKTVAGLAWIDPSRHGAPRSPATPRIERIDVRGVPHALPEGTLALGPQERDVAIRYTVAELSRPDAVRFQYRLRPVSDAWTDAGASRDVVLTRLPPGASTFEVRAMLGSQVSTTIATLRIDREIAFDETVAFKVLIAVAAIGVAGLIFALRMRAVTRRLRIRADEREAIARDIHDTLLQRLQGAMLTMESLANRPTIPANERHDIARVAEEAKDAIVAGRERIQGLRDGADASVALYDHLLAEGRRLSTRHGMPFAVTLSGTPVTLREAAATQLGAIAVEAMSNAFTHSNGTRVDVTIAYETGGVWLSVADDGQGFDPDAVGRASGSGHFGFRGMRERAATLRGKVRVESAPGEGAEIHVFIPRRTAYQ